MITLLSFGAELDLETAKTFNSIPANDNAYNIYKCFSIVFGEDFNHPHSGVFYSVTKSEFKCCIAQGTKSISADGIAIVYISCHGRVVDDDLSVLFSDYSEDRNAGHMNILALGKMLLKLKCKVILIIDCCYSNKTNVLYKIIRSHQDELKNLSVLSACNKTEESAVDIADMACPGYIGDGTLFTKYLYNALMQISQEDEDITLQAIKNKMHGDSGIIVFDGDGDIALKRRVGFIKLDPLYLKRFFNEINRSELFKKETLWYSIHEYPEKYRMEILNEWRQNRCPSGEPSWLIRRAIGYVIGSLSGISPFRDEFVANLFASQNWMHKSIGLFSVKRQGFGSISLDSVKTEILNARSGDILWLGHLIYTDSMHADITFSLSTNLARTSWGIIDIWKRFQHLHSPSNDIIKKITDSIQDSLIMRNFCNHIYLDQGCEKSILNEIEFDGGLCNSKLAQYLYSCNRRNKTDPKNANWLYSVLYGRWRDNVYADLTEYFENNGTDLIKKELEKGWYLPSVELRMALYDYISNSKEISEKYCEQLLWGLSDKHPWVRRSAIRALKGHLAAMTSFDPKNIDPMLFPGYLDYFIEIANNGYSIKQDIVEAGLLDSEKKALIAFLNLDNHVRDA